MKGGDGGEGHDVVEEVVGEVGLSDLETVEQRTASEGRHEPFLSDWAINKAEVPQVEDWGCLLMFGELPELLGSEVLEDGREVAVVER